MMSSVRAILKFDFLTCASWFAAIKSAKGSIKQG